MKTSDTCPASGSLGDTPRISAAARYLVLGICAAVFFLGLQARLSVFKSGSTPLTPNTVSKLALDANNCKPHGTLAPMVVWLAALWLATPVAEHRIWLVVHRRPAHPRHPALLALDRFFRPPPHSGSLAIL
jgi:hypothetical protein